jgi:hypothetical protein
MKHPRGVLSIVARLAAFELLFLSGASVWGADSLVVNGDFQEWTDGVPDGWKVEIGAMNGAETPKSEVAPIKGPALMLRGDASTMAWHSLGQEIPAAAGGSYRLEFESRTKDVRREGRQHDNCYVGIVIEGESEGQPKRESEDVSGDTDWKKHRIEFAVPEKAKSTKVMMFLSKTGVLGVRNVTVTASDVETAPAVEPAAAAPSQPAGLLVNGDFSKWTGGRPDGWTVDIGASNGANTPKSEIQQLSDPGLLLRGNASTMAWHSLSQELSVQEGRTYTLEFQAHAENIRQQGRQFDNCYVGVMCFDARGNRAGMSMEDLSSARGWKNYRVDFKVPANAEKTQVLVFLSKSGTLSVKNLRVQEVTPRSSFRGSRR